MNGRTALVTGGAGFVGGRLVRRLLARGAAVTVLDDLFTGDAVTIPSGVKFVKGSVCDELLVERVVREADYVFHLAAQNIIVSTSQPRSDLAVNAGGTLNVLLAARDAPRVRRVVYASSASVYGNANGACRESDPPNMLSPYAVSKLAGEHYCSMFYACHAVPVTVVRYSNVYGPGQSPTNPYCGVIGKFFDACLKDEPLHVYGAGDHTRDYTYVDDAVRATIELAQAKDAANNVYNIGTGVETSSLQLAELVRGVVGLDVPIRHMPPRPIDGIRRRVMDVSKLRGAIGWAPGMPLADGLRSAYQWLQQ